MERQDPRRPDRQPPPSLFGIGSAPSSSPHAADAVGLEVRHRFSLPGLFEDFGNDNPVISAIPTPTWTSCSRRGRAPRSSRRCASPCWHVGRVSSPCRWRCCRPGSARPTDVRVVVRGVSNVIRAFPDILWALLFVAAVGIGAARPGLFFFSIAVVTKLTADTLDGIDVGRWRRPTSGARHSQMLRTAVVPQILPPTPRTRSTPSSSTCGRRA